MNYARTSILAVFAVSAFANADTILVPSEYNTIQEGIDAAVDGDIISVEQGHYYELINFSGKQITVSSASGLPSNTTIDGNTSSGSVVTFESGETSASVLEGFTIKNGSAFTGAGIRIKGASPVIRNCVVKNNSSGGSGAGIYAENATITLEDTTVMDNISGGAGGGLYLKFCEGSITDCAFEENVANRGAGMYIKDSTGDLTLSDTAFDGNIANIEGGAVYNKASTAVVNDCSFVNNASIQGGAWLSYIGGDAVITNSVFSNNRATNTGGAAEVRNLSALQFTQCLFDSNIADSDCDGGGGSSVVEIVNSTVTLNNPTICNNLVCDVSGDFSEEQPAIIGEVLECVIGIGACCGGNACWEMEEEMCLEGGGLWNGDTTLCATVVCEGGSSSCPGDLNGDGSVEVLDIIELISSWGACP